MVCTHSNTNAIDEIPHLLLGHPPPVMAGGRGQQADDRRQSRLHVLVQSIERSRWIDKWVNGDQNARDRRHVSISMRLLLVSVKDNIGTSIDLCPQKTRPPPCAALIPPTQVVTKDISMLSEPLSRFIPTQVPGSLSPSLSHADHIAMLFMRISTPLRLLTSQQDHHLQACHGITASSMPAGVGHWDDTPTDLSFSPAFPLILSLYVCVCVCE